MFFDVDQTATTSNITNSVVDSNALQNVFIKLKIALIEMFWIIDAVKSHFTDFSLKQTSILQFSNLLFIAHWMR